MAFLRKKREAPRIDLTPMVDVVFLLLIFFMISTTFVETPGITITLPEADESTMTKEPNEVTVFLSESGDIFLGDELTTLEELQRKLGEYGENAAKTSFVLQADQNARHGQVVELMEAARAAGFLNLAVATRTPGGK